MVLVLVLGGGIGWVAQRTKIQTDAVRGISTAGGVRYNWQYVSGKYDPKAKRQRRGRLRLRVIDWSVTDEP